MLRGTVPGMIYNGYSTAVYPLCAVDLPNLYAGAIIVTGASHVPRLIVLYVLAAERPDLTVAQTRARPNVGSFFGVSYSCTRYQVSYTKERVLLPIAGFRA